MIKIINIPQLKDNYAYGLIKNKEIIIIDPADSISILKYINQNKLLLKAILLTHHHSDHTAGVKDINNKFKVPIYSSNKKIKHTSVIVKNNDIINLGFIKFKVISTPGHTLDHVSYYDEKNKYLFCGDVLFRLGCGRIFEGDSAQMFESLQKLNQLSDDTNVYCGHEYSLNNLNFLLSLFPKNKNLLMQREYIEIQLKKTGSSIPFNLGKEKSVNPFLEPKIKDYDEFKNINNLSNYQLFSYLRDLKNKF